MYKYRKNGTTHYRPARYAKPLRDPVIRQVADTITKMTPREISDRSWVSPSAARNLLSGKTNRPQHLTVAGIVRAAGYEFTLTRKR